MQELTEMIEIALQEGDQVEAEALYREIEEVSREIEESVHWTSTNWSDKVVMTGIPCPIASRIKIKKQKPTCSQPR